MSTHKLAPCGRTFGLVLLFIAITTSGSAQTTIASPPGSPPPGLMPTDSVIASYSYSTKGDLRRAGKLGEVDVNSFSFSYEKMKRLDNGLRLRMGLEYQSAQLGLTEGVPLPDELVRVGFNFSGMKPLSPGMSLGVNLRPGFASDSSHFSSADFIVGGGVIFIREVSPDLSWSLGLGGTTRGKNRVLPIGGVRWRWAPDWLLEVGIPATAVTYEVTPMFNVRLGLGMQGGTYHVNRAAQPALDDTYLEYREIRAGLRGDYRISRHFSIEAEAGAVLDRRFEYYDRDYKIKGGSAGYFSVAARIRF